MDRILAFTSVHNRRGSTLAILDMLDRQRAQETEAFSLDLLVIDDGSTDGTAEAVQSRHPDATLLRGDGSLWWGGAMNLGFDYALKGGYDFVYLLNDDITLRDDTLPELHRAAKANPDAACGSFLLNADGTLLGAQYFLSPFLRKLQNPLKGRAYASIQQELLECGTLPTQSVLIPMGVLRQGLRVDTDSFPHSYSDLDFFDSVRRAGFRLLAVRKSVILTTESTSNFHHFLLRTGWGELWRSFFSIRYAHNLRNQASMAFKNSGRLSGALRFALLLAPYAFWMAAKALCPRPLLLRLMGSRLGAEAGKEPGAKPDKDAP